MLSSSRKPANLAVVADAPPWDPVAVGGAGQGAYTDLLFNKRHLACYMMRHGESKDTQTKPAHLDAAPGMR